MSAWTDRIQEFPTEDAARNYLKLHLTNTTDIFVVKPFITDEWAWRERDRLTCGEYVKLIWEGSPWFDERVEELCVFGHVDEDDPSKVCYTPDAKKGEIDRKTSTTPGRFLKKFYGDVLTEEEIKHQVDLHKEAFVTGDYQLKWARTPEEITNVYEMQASFNSCMQHKLEKEWPKLAVHPTSVYGAGDLAIAYITKGERLIARAVVWEEKKRVGRVYGDAVRFRTALKAYGIETKSSLESFDTMEGARLLKVMHTEQKDAEHPCIILPYIDGNANNVNTEGDHLVIASGKLIKDRSGKERYVDCGQFLACFPEGITHGRKKCARCGQYGYERNVIVGSRTSAIEIFHPRWEMYCEACSAENCFYCDDTLDYYLADKFTCCDVYYYDYDNMRNSKKSVCYEQHPSRYVKSVFSGKLWDIDSTVELGDGSRCSLDEALSLCRAGPDGKLYPDEIYVKLALPPVANDMFCVERLIA